MSRESKPGDVTLTVTVDATTAAYLRALTRSTAVPRGTLDDVLARLVHSAADGLRRPGAWERGWLEQAFGEFPEGPQTEGVHYSHREPFEPVRVDEIDVQSACARCGSHAAVHLTQWAAWECLGCLVVEHAQGSRPFAEYDASHIPAEDLAVASLLAFVELACTERAERVRCNDCGQASRRLTEQEFDGKPYPVCPACLVEHERDFPQ